MTKDRRIRNEERRKDTRRKELEERKEIGSAREKDIKGKKRRNINHKVKKEKELEQYGEICRELHFFSVFIMMFDSLVCVSVSAYCT